jgi:hypothetical protein
MFSSFKSISAYKASCAVLIKDFVSSISLPNSDITSLTSAISSF